MNRRARRRPADVLAAGVGRPVHGVLLSAAASSSLSSSPRRARAWRLRAFRWLSASSSLRAPRPPWSLALSPGARRFARAGSGGTPWRAVGSSGAPPEEDAEAEGSGVGRPARRSSSPANGASSSGPSARARGFSLRPPELLTSRSPPRRPLLALDRVSGRHREVGSVLERVVGGGGGGGGVRRGFGGVRGDAESRRVERVGGIGRTLTPRGARRRSRTRARSGKRSAFAAAGCAHHGSAFSTLPHADACPRFAESAGFGGSSSARQRVGSNPSRLAVGARRCCGDADAEEERGRDARGAATRRRRWW